MNRGPALSCMLLLGWTLAECATAQAKPTATGNRLGVFAGAELTDEFYNRDKALSYHFGAVLERQGLSPEVRVSVTKIKATYPIYMGTGGLRYTFEFTPRLRPYAYVGAGPVRTRTDLDPQTGRSFAVTWGPALQGAVGVNWTVSDHLAWTVAEGSVSRLFTHDPRTPVSLGTGLLFRF